MFGNKYQGDDLAKEFFKIMEIKKSASHGDAEVDSDNPDPASFLVPPGPEATPLDQELLGHLDGLRNMASDAEDQPKDDYDDECGDMYSDDGLPDVTDETSMLMDNMMNHRAASILAGLGKIAGSLRVRGENFASDVVEATALSIKDDIVKVAAEKSEKIALLNKIAKQVSDKGDSFSSDLVKASILKIKNSSSF